MSLGQKLAMGFVTLMAVSSLSFAFYAMGHGLWGNDNSYARTTLSVASQRESSEIKKPTQALSQEATPTLTTEPTKAIKKVVEQPTPEPTKVVEKVAVAPTKEPEKYKVTEGVVLSEHDKKIAQSMAEARAAEDERVAQGLPMKPDPNAGDMYAEGGNFKELLQDYKEPQVKKPYISAYVISGAILLPPSSQQGFFDYDRLCERCGKRTSMFDGLYVDRSKTYSSSFYCNICKKVQWIEIRFDVEYR